MASDFCLFWNRNLIAYLVVCGMVGFLRVCMHSEKPLFYGNLTVMTAAVAGLFFLYLYRIRHNKSWRLHGIVQQNPLLKKECILYGLLFLFLMYIMFYVFIKRWDFIRAVLRY